MSQFTKLPARETKISHEQTLESNLTQTQMENATRIRDTQQDTSHARHDANKLAQTDDVSSCSQEKCLICGDDEKQTTRVGRTTCRNGHSLCETCHNDYVLRDDTQTAHCPLCPL